MVCADDTHILRYYEDMVQTSFTSGIGEGEEVEEAFEPLTSPAESIRSGLWIGDCFVYTTSSQLKYLVGDQTYTITHLDQPYSILGYLARNNAIYLANKSVQFVLYSLHEITLEFQTFVLKGSLRSLLRCYRRSLLKKLERWHVSWMTKANLSLHSTWQRILITGST